ncbi:MAG TPA: capsule assembly Wzi family protein [Steroidobacteraceae bacterium]|nr:capsule assembly Wzi family protein [Steroidobacteraceae bacterium]
MRRRFALALLPFVSGAAFADPWLAPGDVVLRHDIELLADAGILHGPVMSWPLSWPDIARDLQPVLPSAELDRATTEALLRVKRLAAGSSDGGFSGLGVRAAAASSPTMLRTFEDTPREEGEAGARASWLSDHLVLNLEATVVVDPQDDQQFRADGSYLGINVGNWAISAGLIDRWWGPGWDGSLILSTNARPPPSLTIERNYSDPFKSKWLSWIGPWRFSFGMAQMEGSDVAVADVLLMETRLSMKPLPWLEFGLSRTAQWCGEGRPCDFDAFRNMLLGQDNEVTDGDVSQQPGNQMAGYDLRLRSPWKALPITFFTQWIGEDEAGGLPSKFLGLAGLEGWHSTGWGAVRWRAEFADTTCVFTRETPEYNCAYRNAAYPQGYTYRGRIMGYSTDNDSRSRSYSGMLVRPDGSQYSLAFRDVDLNRDGGPHTISTIPQRLRNVELRHSRVLGAGRIGIGAGFDDLAEGSADSEFRGFVTYEQGF